MTFKLNWQSRKTRTWKIILLGIFIALSAVIQVVENMVFPSSLPIRLGIANIIIIFVLSFFGIFEATIVAISRSILASILTGKFLSLPFFLSISGGVAAALVMGLIFNKSKNLGIVGVSVIGATVHNFTQLAVIYFLLIRNPGIFNLVPWVWLSALVTGLIVGFTAQGALNLTLVKNLVSQLNEPVDSQGIPHPHEK